MFKNQKFFMSLFCVIGLGFAQVAWAPEEEEFQAKAPGEQAKAPVSDPVEDRVNDVAARMLGPDDESLLDANNPDDFYYARARNLVRQKAQLEAENRLMKYKKAGFLQKAQMLWSGKLSPLEEKGELDPIKLSQAKIRAVAETFDAQHPLKKDPVNLQADPAASLSATDGFDLGDSISRLERARNLARPHVEKSIAAEKAKQENDALNKASLEELQRQKRDPKILQQRANLAMKKIVPLAKSGQIDEAYDALLNAFPPRGYTMYSDFMKNLVQEETQFFQDMAKPNANRKSSDATDIVKIPDSALKDGQTYTKYLLEQGRTHYMQRYLEIPGLNQRSFQALMDEVVASIKTAKENLLHNSK